MRPVTLLCSVVLLSAVSTVAATRHWSNCEGQEDYRMGDGRDYIGHVHKTKSGLECQPWNSQSPHHHDVALDVARGIGSHNYCRAPFAGQQSGSSELSNGPGCFTSDPSVRYELCDVGTVCIPVSTSTGEPICSVKLSPSKTVLRKGTPEAEVSFSCLDARDAEKSAQFFYTLDGSIPTANSKSVSVSANGGADTGSNTVTLAKQGLVTIRVFALVQGRYPTNTVERTYTVVPGNLASPVVSPPSKGKIYHSAVLVSATGGGEGTWIEYWKGTTDPDEAPVRVKYDPLQPFWVKKTQEINFQTVDSLGRRSETTTVTYDVRDVAIAKEPRFFPASTVQSVFFGGVRFMISSSTPGSKIWVRLNGTNTLGVKWFQLGASTTGIPYLSLTTLGKTVIEAKTVAPTAAESDIVVQTVTVLPAPAIECDPSPEVAYHHLMEVQCKAIQGPNPLAVAPVTLKIKHRATVGGAVVSTTSNVNSTFYLTSQGVYEVEATTFTGSIYDLGSGDLATTKKITYTITSNGLPPPVVTRADGGDAKAWVGAGGPVKALGHVQFTIAVPKLPMGITLKLSGTVNGEDWSPYLLDGSQVKITGTNDTQSVTLVLKSLDEGAKSLFASYKVAASTHLVSNKNKDVLLVKGSSGPTTVNMALYPYGDSASDYVQLDCDANKDLTQQGDSLAAIQKAIIQNTVIPCGMYVDVLYKSPKFTLRLTGFPSEELASLATQQLVSTMTGVCPAAVTSKLPAIVDPWSQFTLKSQWEGVAVVGVGFSLQFLTAKGNAVTDAATFKVVNSGVPCNAFTVVRPVKADGTSGIVELDGEGDHSICVKGPKADSQYFRLPRVLPVRRAESHLAVSLSPAGGSFPNDADLEVAVGLTGICDGNRQVVVKLAVDAGPWQEGNCKTRISLPRGTHFVSAMAEATLTNKDGKKTLHYGRQIHAVYKIGSKAATVKALDTDTLTYSYHVISDQSAEFYFHSSAKQLTEEALTTVRVLPINSSCSDFSVAPIGGSVATRMSAEFGNSTLRRTVAPFLFSSGNSIDSLVVCLGRNGPISPYPGAAPFSIGQLGLHHCHRHAAFNETQGPMGWNQHCYIKLGRYGGCSEVSYLGQPQRLCMCRDGKPPTETDSTDEESVSKLECGAFTGASFGEENGHHIVMYGSRGKAAVYGVALICFCAFVAWLVQQNRDLEAEAAEQDPTSKENMRRSPSKSKGRGVSFASPGPAPRCPVDPECVALNDANTTVVTVEGDLDLSAVMTLDLEDGSKDEGIIQLLRKDRTGELFLWQRKGQEDAPLLEECSSASEAISLFRTVVQGMQRRGWDAKFASEGLVLTEELDGLGILVQNNTASPTFSPVASPTNTKPPQSVMLVAPGTAVDRSE